jgi:hypothetical protein
MVAGNGGCFVLALPVFALLTTTTNHVGMRFWAQIALLVVVIATMVAAAPHFEGFTLASVVR